MTIVKIIITCLQDDGLSHTISNAPILRSPNSSFSTKFSCVDPPSNYLSFPVFNFVSLLALQRTIGPPDVRSLHDMPSTPPPNLSYVVNRSPSLTQVTLVVSHYFSCGYGTSIYVAGKTRLHSCCLKNKFTVCKDCHVPSLWAEKDGHERRWREEQNKFITQ